MNSNQSQICNFVLGHTSLLKLMMFLGWPRRTGSVPLLLDGAMSVDEDLVGALALPTVSLLSSGLFDVGYGSTLVTLQRGQGCEE